VLVVDDRPENCDLYREYLTYMGFRVVDADNGATAIERAIAEKPDVIVMDLAMPTMDGFQATRLLKTDANTKMIPIVVVTASGVEQHARAEEAGCDAFLVKPCALDDLEGVLRNCVMLARA
jgi:two-component system cell cycle response regulator DivK